MTDEGRVIAMRAKVSGPLPPPPTWGKRLHVWASWQVAGVEFDLLDAAIERFAARFELRGIEGRAVTRIATVVGNALVHALVALEPAAELGARRCVNAGLRVVVAGVEAKRLLERAGADRTALELAERVTGGIAVAAEAIASAAERGARLLERLFPDGKQEN